MAHSGFYNTGAYTQPVLNVHTNIHMQILSKQLAADKQHVNLLAELEHSLPVILVRKIERPDEYSEVLGDYCDALFTAESSIEPVSDEYECFDAPLDRDTELDNWYEALNTFDDLTRQVTAWRLLAELSSKIEPDDTTSTPARLRQITFNIMSQNPVNAQSCVDALLCYQANHQPVQEQQVVSVSRMSPGP